MQKATATTQLGNKCFLECFGMVNQRDKSHCCGAHFEVFISGGGGQVKGPYVMCTNCRVEYPVSYKTGDVEIGDFEMKNEHPLLNPDSPHYLLMGDETIEQFEKLFTVEELKVWAKITAYKYRLRIGKKDDPAKEIVKIKTFEDYWLWLDGGNLK